MKNDLVSIIVPTYKGSDIICKCIDSIIQQSYKNIEVIVVDDNGKDTQEQIATEEKLQKYINILGFQYVAHEKNKNGSAARNTGLKKAIGEYICFFDDDDVYYMDAINAMYEKLKSTSEECALVYCSLASVSNSGQQRVIEARKDGEMLVDYLLRKVFLCSSNVMFKRQVIDEIGGFDESFKRHQDMEVITRVLVKYLAVHENYIGIKKVWLKRNLPTEACIVEAYGQHYIGKMKPYIEKLPQLDQERIYSHFYIDWSKGYLYERNFKKFWYYAMLSTHPIKCTALAVKYVVGQLIH